MAAVLLIVTLSLEGQTPEKGKTAATSAAPKPAALSNEDLNLRAMELLRTDVRKQKGQYHGPGHAV
jgi:hypothetical protein